MYALLMLLGLAIGPEEFNAARTPQQTQAAQPAPRHRYTVDELIANSRKNDAPQQNNNGGGGRRRLFKK